ncbi:MAG TPA: hypothetical protein VNG13_10375 [Mycobacteriales bacterium]|nr:hypothetical protein [Mycobacteriales bacterium]
MPEVAQEHGFGERLGLGEQSAGGRNVGSIRPINAHTGAQVDEQSWQ